MKAPAPADLRLAAEWLAENEGEGEELAACGNVARWLRRLADQAEERAEIRLLASETGQSVKVVRRVIRSGAGRAG